MKTLLPDESAMITPTAASAPPAASPGRLVLVLNCGSSSIKFALFDAAQAPLPRTPLWQGKIGGIGGPAPLFEESDASPHPLAAASSQAYPEALAYLLQRIEQRLDGHRLALVAHRIVHGGSKYAAPTRMTPEVLADLKRYIPLAPLHQPFALEAIGILMRKHPDLPQAACFDTAFHHTLPVLEQVLPLPYEAWEHGLRRYGFHGLSYQYLSIVLDEKYPHVASQRVIAAHLGSGASLCAMHQLQSVATTMGFSALDGLMMGTRCGALDPGALLYLMEIEKLSLADVGQLLYHQSGLLGVSGLSAEPRVLVTHEADPGPTGERARLALALYVHRIVKEIGALIAVLGGLDLLVFTAGVGEHNAFIRQRVCAQLGFIGVELDDAANQAHQAVISAERSRVRVAVEPTNEEWMAACQTLQWC